jgi:hypothetical protein
VYPTTVSGNPGRADPIHPGERQEIDLSLRGGTSGLSTLNKYQIAERGARMTRRVDREYREYLREAQRSQPGCPAREVVLDQRGQATSVIGLQTIYGESQATLLDLASTARLERQ